MRREGGSKSLRLLRCLPDIVHSWLDIVIDRLCALRSSDVRIGVVHLTHRSSGGSIRVGIGIDVAIAL